MSPLRESTIAVLFCGKTKAYFSGAGGQRLEPSNYRIFCSRLLPNRQDMQRPGVGQGGCFAIDRTRARAAGFGNFL